MAALTLHTIGHGTRPLIELLSMLQSATVELLIDVRAFPASRANPQYNKEALIRSLPDAGVAYEHWPSLGGRRRGLGADSPNAAWKHPSFRAYADYMLTNDFWAALDQLLRRAQAQPATIMCSETLWWRCHRRMIADAATARGAAVVHLLQREKTQAHVLSPPARLVGDRVVYSAPAV
jgi:uncharacterized protein (DUF488 family)